MLSRTPQLPDSAHLAQVPADLRTDICQYQVNWDFHATIRRCRNNYPNACARRGETAQLLQH
jgi:hypothetical protein